MPASQVTTTAKLTLCKNIKAFSCKTLYRKKTIARKEKFDYVCTIWFELRYALGCYYHFVRNNLTQIL